MVNRGAAALFKPGDTVRLDDAPEWGIGEVQSVAGTRVTVNFEDAGKQVLNASVARLSRVSREK